MAILSGTLICMLLRTQEQIAGGKRPFAPCTLWLTQQVKQYHLCLYRQGWRWSQRQCKPLPCILLPLTHSSNRPGSVKTLKTPYAKQHSELPATVHATCRPKHGTG